METHCIKCKKIISKRDQQLRCVTCTQNYHVDCTNVSEKRFYLMTTENKTKWKCDHCWCKTQNENYIINVSTDNSFESLSDHDYTDNIFISQNSRLNSSCPDLHRLNMEEIIEELKKQNNKLKEKLQIAENEIENLLFENSNLKKSLSSHETKTKYLEKICSSNSKKNITIRKNRKSLSGTTLDFMQDEKEENNTNLVQEVHPAPSKIKTTNYVENFNDSSTPSNRNLNSSSTYVLDAACTKTKKKNIHIIGDEQVRGLAEKMKHQRSGKWNDIYNVCGIVKPFASSAQVLKSCENLHEYLTQDDILILSVGSNDKNPYEIITNICNALCNMRECKIFLLSIRHNNYLNVQKLNAEINFIVKNYKNCTFINIDHVLNGYSYHNRTSHLHKISHKLNIDIDYIEYEQQYILNVSKLRNNLKCKSCISNNLSVEKNNNTPLPKKGTIPFYFPSLKNVSNIDIKSPNKNVQDCFRA